MRENWKSIRKLQDGPYTLEIIKSLEYEYRVKCSSKDSEEIAIADGSYQADDLFHTLLHILTLQEIQKQHKLLDNFKSEWLDLNPLVLFRLLDINTIATLHLKKGRMYNNLYLQNDRKKVMMLLVMISKYHKDYPPSYPF